MIKRVRIVVSGRVQGVSYRYYVLESAKQLDIKGWVRNKDENDVEITAEGEDKNLNTFLERCKKGPIFAKVSHFELNFERPTGEFNNFDVKY